MLLYSAAIVVHLLLAANTNAPSKPERLPSSLANSSANSLANSLAIVALDGPDVRAEVARLFELARERGTYVLDADAVSQKVRMVPANCGTDAASANAAVATPLCDSKLSDSSNCYCRYSEEALAIMLQSAYEAEGHFQDQKAAELRRKIINIFNREPQPSVRMVQIAGEALLGRASGSYAQGNNEEAAKWARQAMRHFSSVRIDPMLFSPPLRKLFDKALAAVKHENQFKILVRSDVVGQLWADGNNLGAINQQKIITLPAGDYRLWLMASDGTLTLPQAVVLRAKSDQDTQASAAVKEVEINFDHRLDQRLVLNKPVLVRCAGNECQDLLVRLRIRLGVSELVGIGYGPNSVLQALLVSAQAPPRWIPVSAFGGELFGNQNFVEPAKLATNPDAAAVPQNNAAPPPSFLSRHKWQLMAGIAGAIALGVGAYHHKQAIDARDKAATKGISQAEHNTFNRNADSKTEMALIFYGIGAAGMGTAGIMFWLDF
ncbi:MAG: hypothetical protein JW841_06005 [Deltaproteobacteria bacterium]|nr:hypothetical protein [Deltaproteobacteria bacterium]